MARRLVALVVVAVALVGCGEDANTFSEPGGGLQSSTTTAGADVGASPSEVCPDTVTHGDLDTERATGSETPDEGLRRYAGEDADDYERVRETARQVFYVRGAEDPSRYELVEVAQVDGGWLAVAVNKCS